MNLLKEDKSKDTKGVVELKFMVIFRQYPNGALYHYKTFPIGSGPRQLKRKPKQKKQLKEVKLQQSEEY